MNPSYDIDWRELLSAQERMQMLDDIARVSLAVGRPLFPDRPWDDLDVAESQRAFQSPVERLGLMEQMLPPLSQAVHQIAHAPLESLVTESRPISPPERARRVTTGAVMKAVRGQHAARFLEEQRAASSVDTLENRAVKSFLRFLDRDARTLARMATAEDDEGLRGSAAACARRFQDLRAMPLFAQVAEDADAWRMPPTSRMAAQPMYAPVAAWARRYRQSFQFAWNDPLFTLPPRDCWRLYEVWGFLKTLDALLSLGCMAQAERKDTLAAIMDDRWSAALAQGEESRIGLRSPHGKPIALFYNRSYLSQMRSLSRTMRPDISLETAPQQTWILDTKFKTYDTPGAEAEDIDRMHAYRDAIVDTGGNRLVQRAWCLYPGRAGGANRPVIAYGAPEESVVGALCLRPGDTAGFARLRQLLAGWLAHG